MTLILPRLTKRSLFTPDIDEKEHRRQIDQDLQNLFIALRPSLVLDIVQADTVTMDVSLSIHWRLTLDRNVTFAAPTNPRDGQQLLLQLTQDITGSRTITWNSIFEFGTDIGTPVLTTGANKVDFLQFVYDSVADKWRCVGFLRGYD